MSRTGLLGASLVLAALMACLLALLAASQKAEAAFPGKNGEIAFIGNDQVFAVRSDGSRLRPLTPDPSDGLPGMPHMYWGEAPQWSPGGEHVLFHANQAYWLDGEIYLAKADGPGISRITDTFETAFENNPQWYPSGRKIVFCAAPTLPDTYMQEPRISGDYEIYSLRLDRKKRPAGPPVQLTDNDSYDCPHSVSPDGEKMAFVSDRDGDSEIYVVGAAKPEGTSNPAARLTDNATFDASPDWSPDGKKITYAGIGDGDEGDVFVMRADGTAKRNLTESAEASEFTPTWSPDGSRIAFARSQRLEDDSWDGGIWKMRADGTGVSRVTSGYGHQSPDWRPIP